jgi:hypothetical protein
MRIKSSIIRKVGYKHRSVWFYLSFISWQKEGHRDYLNLREENKNRDKK